MPRRFTRKHNWEFGGRPDPSEIESGEPKSRKRRLATTLVFTTIFFAGASFAAVAGDQLTPLLSSDGPMGTIASDETTTTDASTTDPSAPADATAAAPATDPARDSGLGLAPGWCRGRRPRGRGDPHRERVETETGGRPSGRRQGSG